LGVDENPKSLKCARRRVLAWLAGLDRASHEFGQLPCAAEGATLLAASSNRLCNRKSKPFFAEFTNHLRDLFHVRRRQPVRRALPARGVHAHVERAVAPKRKTPRGVVDLRGAHA